MVGQIVKNGPRHDLKQRSVKRSGQAGTGEHAVDAGGMEVVVVRTVPHNVDKLREGVTALRQTGLVGRQIARDDVRGPWAGYRPEIAAAAEVHGRIDDGWADLTKPRLNVTRSVPLFSSLMRYISAWLMGWISASLMDYISAAAASLGVPAAAAIFAGAARTPLGR